MNKYKLIIEIGMEFSDRMMEEDLEFNEAVTSGEMGFTGIDLQVIDEQDGEVVEFDSVQSEGLMMAILSSLKEDAGAE